MEKKKSSSPTKRYYVFLGVFLPLLLFFCSSDFLFSKEGDVQETPLWSSEKINYQISLSLLNWQYNPYTKYMEAMFLIENTQDRYDTNFDAVAYCRKDQNIKLSGVSVSFQYDQIMVVQIEAAPSDWDVIKINLSESSSKSYVSFYCDYRTVKSSELLVPKSESEYLVMGIDKQIEKIGRDIRGLEEEISEHNKTISILEDEIQALEDEKKYQTDKEVTTSVQKQIVKEKEIEQHNRIKESLRDEIKLMEEKSVKLSEKLIDAQSGNLFSL